MTEHVSDDPGRVPRITFAEPGAAERSLDALLTGRPYDQPGPRRYMLRLTPNGAPPLATSLAALDRALVIFSITGATTTPEHIAEHIITALELGGRVHVVLEPIPTGTDENGT
jgi:hypothetical protein